MTGHLHNDNPYGLKEGELSSGTTIMAIPCPQYNTVILGADSRTSTGTYVANRTSDKIVQLSAHIFACRSGSAADTQTITDYIRYYLSSLAYVYLLLVIILFLVFLFPFFDQAIQECENRFTLHTAFWSPKVA